MDSMKFQTIYMYLTRCTMSQELDSWAQLFKKVDNAIHLINLYPVDNAINFPNTNPLDSNLSGG